jgi:cell division septum initiation protein DivIVA
MAPEESARGDGARPPRRRRTSDVRGKRVGGGELIQQLNDMVAELIKENRRLKREVDKLTARGSAAASSAVERSLQTIQRRVQKALTAPVKRRSRKKSGAGTTRRKTVTRKRRKT